MPKATSTTKKKTVANSATNKPKTTITASTSSKTETCKSNICHKTLYLLIGLVIVLQLLTLAGAGAKKALLKMEAMKVGGMQNLEKLTEIYKSDKYMEYQEKSIEQLEKAIENPSAAPAAEQPTAPAAEQPTAPAAADNTISDAQLKEVTDMVRIHGADNPDIVILEFSDFQCPFCQRHYEQKTLETVANKYDGKVGLAMLHFPLSFHQQAEPAARAAECVFAEGGADAYYKFVHAVFTNKDLTKEGLVKDAEEAGVDANKVATCFDNGDHAADVQAQMALGQRLFRVSGTPGNVVLNLKTKKWILVSGAQGPAAFENAVNQLLN